MKALILLLFCFSCKSIVGQNIGNYVNNGSFEEYFVNGIPYPYYWKTLYGNKYFGEILVPPNKVPFCSFGYQWPYHGKNDFITSPYSYYINNNRGYPRNELKSILKAGSVYCVSFYVNLSDQSSYGIDAIGAYFGDSSLDTITKCTDPITYLIPQVQNPVNNIITDTMNWTLIKGNFVANGTEKYMVIGNFRSNATTNSAISNTINLSVTFSDYLIDAVSVVEVNLPAYAGPDTSVAPGSLVYLGRELDFAIDSGCVWFKLPGMVPIDTASGIWVNPTVTTTYVVRQILDCSSEKWDTVVVHMNLTGVVSLSRFEDRFSIYPNPANDFLELRITSPELFKEFHSIAIYNSLGQLVREEEIQFENKTLMIQTENLANGVYSLQLKSNSEETVSKRFVINK